MNRIVLSVFIAALLSGNAARSEAMPSLSVEPRKEEVKYSPVYLQNEFLKLELLPDDMGRLSQITYLPAAQNMLMPFTAEKVAYDPMFSRMESNGMGWRDLFWGAKGLTASMNPMIMEADRQPRSISFSAANYGPLKISLRRIVKLAENSTVFEINSTVTRLDSDKPMLLSPWYNLVPAGPGTGMLIIPARGGVRSLSSVVCRYFPEDILLQDADVINFIAPARNWIAICYPEAKLVLAITVPEQLLKPDGFFYFWRGKVNGRSVKTMEIILSGKNLNPGESYAYSCRLGIFPGMSSVKEICNDTAIDCRVEDKGGAWEIELALCPGRQLAAGKLKLELRSFGGQSRNIPVGKAETGELMPAKVKNFKFSIAKHVVPEGIYRISGTFSTEYRFELLLPVVKKDSN